GGSNKGYFPSMRDEILNDPLECNKRDRLIVVAMDDGSSVAVTMDEGHGVDEGLTVNEYLVRPRMKVRLYRTRTTIHHLCHHSTLTSCNACNYDGSYRPVKGQTRCANPEMEERTQESRAAKAGIKRQKELRRS
nr:hypothetical protein [Tanacetum cinerariifolium]